MHTNNTSMFEFLICAGAVIVLAAIVFSMGVTIGALEYIAASVPIATPLKTALENSGLNLLGDSVGGLTAPLALLWLIAAVMMQRQELNLTKTELAKTATAMETQVNLMNEQSAIQRAVASSNYKVTLFEERFALYRWFVNFRDTAQDLLKEEQFNEFSDQVEKTKFLFGQVTYEKSTDVSELVGRLQVHIGSYESRYGDYIIDEKSDLGVFGSKENAEDKKIRRSNIEDLHEEIGLSLVSGEFMRMMTDALALDAEISFPNIKSTQKQQVSQ